LQFCEWIKIEKPEAATSGSIESYRKQPEAQTNIIYLIHSPVVCKIGDLPILLLLQIRCGWCHLIFYLCRSCWRGHRYCSDPCRLAAKRKQRCEAQRRYRQTAKGKKTHCEDENRRRHGLSKKKVKKNMKNMDDASSTRLPAWCKWLLLAIGKRILPVQTKTCCHFCGSCGQIVDEFPRRGYG
jgi:hypothetical protein